MGRMFRSKIKSDSAVDTTCVTDPTVYPITESEYNNLKEEERKNKIFAIIDRDDSPNREFLKRKNKETESIKELQYTLNLCEGANLSVDGYFGNRTVIALRDFQKSHELKVTGEIDIDTWYALNDEKCKYDNSTPVTMATYLDLPDEDIKDNMYIITDRTRNGRNFTAKGEFVTEYFRDNKGCWKCEVHDRSTYTTTSLNNYPYVTTASTSNQYSDNTISDGFDDLRKELEEMKRRMNTKVSLIHNCANCGAQLEIDENKPIFHCKYCGSTYIIGAQQVNATY
jgi:DNA-directed RNA polymerase subunit RPC12/RpoP